MANSDGISPEFDKSLCKVSLNGEKAEPIVPEGPMIVGTSTYTSISFEVGFKSKASKVSLTFAVLLQPTL